MLSKSGFKTKYAACCDLHSKKTTVHIIDRRGNVKLHKETESTPQSFFKIIHPYEKDISIFVESTFNYYWMADVCEKRKIPFFLGHALYIKRARQGKHKDDDRDTILMADLARRESFPLAYPYPAQMRPARDLFRRRMSFVSQRAACYKRIQNMVYQQGDTESVTDLLRRKEDRYDILEKFKDPALQLMVEKDLSMVDHMEPIIAELEFEAQAKAVHYDARSFNILLNMPGVGATSAMTLLYEIHSVNRFPSVQNFASYSRTVKARCTSAGKKVGEGDDKIGNPTLNWVFHEIAVHMPRFSPVIKSWYDKLKKRKGEKCAKAILVHKISVSVYYMLKRKELFDAKRFVGIYPHATNRKL